MQQTFGTMKQSVSKCESTANHVLKKSQRKTNSIAAKSLKKAHWICKGQEVFFAYETFAFLLTDKATVLFTWTLYWLTYILSQYMFNQPTPAQ